MKKIWIGIVLLALLASGCGYTKVPAGYEGVKINTLGGDKGAIQTVKVGRHFYSLKYEMELFPLFKQNYVWTEDVTEGSRTNEAIVFQSKESLTFTANVGISYSVMPGWGDDLYLMYHKGIDEITDIDMRNSVRDAFNRLASSQSVEQIYGEGKAAFVDNVQKMVIEQWEPQGIRVHRIYLVGKMTPPPQVEKSIAAKIEATQKAQMRRNEVAESNAAADKKIAEARGEQESKQKLTDAAAYDIREKAKAEAEAISLIQKQLSESPMYVEFIKAQKWDGKLPTFMGGSDVVPMIALK